MLKKTHQQAHKIEFDKWNESSVFRENIKLLLSSNKTRSSCSCQNIVTDRPSQQDYRRVDKNFKGFTASPSNLLTAKFDLLL